MFNETIKNFSPEFILQDNFTKNHVLSVLEKEQIDLNDLGALLSPAAAELLEPMAQKAHAKTVKRFGYTMNLYTPLYLSNECVNSCVYCGFHTRLAVDRKTLTREEIEKECSVIREQGFSHLLLVSGEHPGKIPFEYILDSVKIAKQYFPHVSIEVYPLEEEQYSFLRENGLDAMTLYQETYDANLYPKYHPAGPKANYEYRINTMDRAGKAGIKKLNIGSLLGLNHWKIETLYLAFHLSYLKKHYWASEVAVSFPRIRESAGAFHPPYPVTDAELVQMIMALRIFDEQTGLVLSTRETESFRNGCMRLGITAMSAGVKTNPGGHIGEEGGKQFIISDSRNPAEMSRHLAANGYDPVWKDWEMGI
jgi:2-iminoacetate synthase